jgi:phenylacetic acid degradation operon negative regulatory protein
MVNPKMLGWQSVSPTYRAEEAFVIRTIAIHEFRRVQLHDPQLPPELLPDNWPGKIAYALCHDIYQRSYQNAQDYVLNSLRKENPEASQAAPYFYQRFNGLKPS